MAELKAVGLVELDEGQHSNSEKKITLRPEFSWFLQEEFRKLRQEFIPDDYSEYLKKEKDDGEDKGASRILPPTPLIKRNFSVRRFSRVPVYI